jgi:hypothetical protein
LFLPRLAQYNQGTPTSKKLRAYSPKQICTLSASSQTRVLAGLCSLHSWCPTRAEKLPMWVIGRKVRDMSQPFTHAHGPEPLAFVMDVSYPGGWSTLGKNHELVGVIGEYFDFPLWNDITGFTQVSSPNGHFCKTTLLDVHHQTVYPGLRPLPYRPDMGLGSKQ